MTTSSEDFDAKVKQVCDLCGLVRYWGVADGTPCPGVNPDGIRCDGRLRYPRLSDADAHPESVISDSTDRVEMVFSVEGGSSQGVDNLSKKDPDPPVNGSATLRNVETMSITSYRDGYAAGQDDAFRYIIAAGGSVLKNSAGADERTRDLLRAFLAKLCGEHAR